MLRFIMSITLRIAKGYFELDAVHHILNDLHNNADSAAVKNFSDMMRHEVMLKISPERVKFAQSVVSSGYYGLDTYTPKQLRVLITDYADIVRKNFIENLAKLHKIPVGYASAIYQISYNNCAAKLVIQIENEFVRQLDFMDTLMLLKNE